MKKIKLIVIGLLSCLCSFAQTSINDIVNIGLPKGAEKLTNEQLKTFVTGKKQYFQEIDRTKSKGDFYLINNMIIQLNGDKVPLPEKNLEELKNAMDALANINGHPLTNYTSEIKNINNFKVLIIHHQSQDYASYTFYCVNNLNTAVLNGGLEYDKNDKSNKDKAAKTLDQILKSMTFK